MATMRTGGLQSDRRKVGKDVEVNRNEGLALC